MMAEPKQYAKLTPEIEALLSRGTKVYHWAPLPNDIEGGPLGMCFDWSAIQCAINFPKYKYVEGIARVKGDKEWTVHAWLSDGVHAFDPTWYSFDNGQPTQHDAPIKYLGIELDFLAVARFMKTTGYQGILGNHWRNPALADACWPKEAL